jgi:hypothetical protein
VGPIEGVVVVDDAVGDDLIKSLLANVLSLSNQQTLRGGIVTYLINPDMYSLNNDEAKKSKPAFDAFIPAHRKLHKTVFMQNPGYPGLKQHFHDELDNGYFARDDSPDKEKDFWARPFVAGSKYQWLPTYFDISAEGKCTIEDDIIGLTPREDHLQAYVQIARLFEIALPYVESVYSYTRTMRPYLVSFAGGWGVRCDIDHPYEKYKINPYNLRGNKLQVSCCSSSRYILQFCIC